MITKNKIKYSLHYITLQDIFTYQLTHSFQKILTMAQPQNPATRFQEESIEENPNKQFRSRIAKISEILRNNELIGDEPMSTKELKSFIQNISELMESSLNVVYHTINLSIAQFRTASKFKEDEAMEFEKQSCIGSMCPRKYGRLATHQICHHSLISRLIQNIDESTFIKRKGFLKDYNSYNDTYFKPARKWKTVDEILQVEQTDHSFLCETGSYFKQSTYQKRMDHQHSNQPMLYGEYEYQEYHSSPVQKIEVDTRDDWIMALKEKLHSNYNDSGCRTMGAEGAKTLYNDNFKRKETFSNKIQPKRHFKPMSNFNKITCVFCQKEKHKLQLYCPKLNKMKPGHIRSIMRKWDIKCEMCLGKKHDTKDCRTVKEKNLKKCLIKENGVECNKYHCRFLHTKRKTKLENKGNYNKQNQEY